MFNRAPNIVFVGDSHVGRLKEWADSMKDDEQRFLLENKCLGMSQYVYSGGSRWDTLYNRVQGIKVPEHQTQGDTLNAVVNNRKITPEFLFWICGTNDIDHYNDKYHEALRKSPLWYMISDDRYGPSKRYKQKHWNWRSSIEIPDDELLLK